MKIKEPTRWWRAGDAVLLMEEALDCIRGSDNPTGCTFGVVDSVDEDGQEKSWFFVANESGRVVMLRNLGGLCPPECPEAAGVRASLESAFAGKTA